MAPTPSPRRVLAFAAHPDDIDFGAAGTLARWASDGAEITYCIMTSGDAGGFDPSDRTGVSELRSEEQRAAARRVGAREVVFLGERDGFLEVSHPVIARAVEQIRTAVTATLRELRSTVKLLRSPAAEPADRSSLGLAGLPSLINQAREAGLSMTMELDTAGAQLDSAVDAAAYRIVQESLTNVLRHSGARHATVAAGFQDGTLELRITDGGGGGNAAGHAASPAAKALPSGEEGRGIQGMAERIGLLGGTFSAGPLPGGGFEVCATLPGRLGP